MQNHHISVAVAVVVRGIKSCVRLGLCKIALAYTNFLHSIRRSGSGHVGIFCVSNMIGCLKFLTNQNALKIASRKIYAKNCF